MPRFVWLVCLVSVAILGCSGSSTSRSTTATTGTSGAKGPITSSTAPPSFSGSSSSTYCSLARQVSESANFSTSSDLEATFQQFDSLAPQFVSSAPAELKSDANLLVSGVGQAEVALRAVNYDVARVDPATLRALQDPKFTAASDRVAAYNSQVCDTSTTATT